MKAFSILEIQLKSKMKNLLIIVLSLSSSTFSFGCEICGCGNSTFQIGILPNFQKGFLGLRYSSATFNSTMRSDASQYSKDYIHSLELWGGYNFKKWQVLAFIPYLSTTKESDDGTITTKGLGDAMALVNYKFINTTHLSKNEKVTIHHELLIGGGIKLPTGINQVDTTAATFNIGDFNSQAGTGSVDYLLNATYNFSWNKSGIVTNVAYRINTANKQDYRFGNRTYLNVSYYYTFAAASLKIMPNIGLNYQSNAINSYAGTEVANSQGYVLNSTMGVNLILKKIGFNVLGFIPTSQNMYDGQTKSQGKILVGITYSL
jgi:hypothetical protein